MKVEESWRFEIPSSSVGFSSPCSNSDYLPVKLLGFLRQTQKVAVSTYDSDVGELLEAVDVLDHVQSESNVRTVLAVRSL
ncbi:MAG: hypothetical protein L0Z50_42680 [Verrucomicrobiales bacterium]|nr:hypothetical protein [Verrucomicrobiales bacterium]